MSNTVVGFTISVDGISSINELNQEIKQTKAAMNALNLTTEEGQKEYAELSQTLGKLTAEQKVLRKQQDDLNKSFMDANKNLGAYDKAAAELNKLRKEFKNAAFDGSKTSKEMAELKNRIQELDSTIKKADGQVGQFQRNVGNYPMTMRRVQRVLMQTIPGFEAFSDVLRDNEGKFNAFGKALMAGFVVFQGAKQIMKAIKFVDDFVKKIEEAKKTIEKFSNTFGDDLNDLTAQATALAQTFGTDAKTIAEAAQALSKKTGISFQEALNKIEKSLVEGKGDATEYLNIIKEYPDTFTDASGEVTKLSEKNQQLLNTNKELSKSQVDVANKLNGTGNTFKLIGNVIQTGFLLYIAKILEVFKPVGVAFGEIGKTIGKFFALFSSGGKSLDLFDNYLNTVTTQFRVTAIIIENFVLGLNFVLEAVFEIVKSIPFLQNFFGVIYNNANLVSDSISNLPNIFSGVLAALKQLGTNFVSFFETLYIDAQIFAKKVQGAFGANVQDAINELRKQREAANKGDISIFDAFNKGFLDSKKKRQEADKKLEEEDAKKKKELTKEEIEAQKKRNEDAAQASKKLAEDRKKFNKDEEKEERSRLSLLSDLNQRYIEEKIQNIKDSQQREIAEIENAFNQQKQQLEKQYETLRIQAKEREEQTIETFKEGSAELLKVQQDNTKMLEEVKIQQGQILEQLEIQTQEKLKQVRDAAAKEELEKAKGYANELRNLRDKLLSDRLNRVESEAEMIDLKNKEALNKLLKGEKDIRKREEYERLAAEQALVDKILAIRAKLYKLDEQEALLKRNAQMGIKISKEEYEAIAKERQKLNTELSGLELEQSDMQQEEANKNKGRWKKTFAEVLDYTKQGLELLSNVLNVMAERQQAQFEKDIEKSQERQSKLQEEIDNSSGLRRRFYEQQLEDEIAAAQKIEKAKADAAKKAAKQQKAIAIIQSIINTALAVTSALLTVPFVPAGLAAAITAGVTGATQTAIIAAQPLAKGGVVGQGNEIAELIPNFDSGGRVTHSGNITPLSNGDNVLATLKTGEVVLNQQQQQRIGYSALKKANIPNFAIGGVVGAPSALITSNNKLVADGKIQMDIMQKMMEETSNRIDRIQVVYTAATDDDVTKGRNERKTIQTIAQF